MRRGSRKMWWVVTCTSRKSSRTESRMNIEEILKAKLATIKEEEPEDGENNGGAAALLPKHHNRCNMSTGKKGKRIYMMKMSQFFRPQFSFKDSYLLFTTGFVSLINTN